jgi:hypothetical protein
MRTRGASRADWDFGETSSTESPASLLGMSSCVRVSPQMTGYSQVRFVVFALTVLLLGACARTDTPSGDSVDESCCLPRERYGVTEGFPCGVVLVDPGNADRRQQAPALMPDHGGKDNRPSRLGSAARPEFGLRIRLLKCGNTAIPGTWHVYLEAGISAGQRTAPLRAATASLRQPKGCISTHNVR